MGKTLFKKLGIVLLQESLSCHSREVITDKYDIRADMVIGKKIKIWNR